MQISLLKRLGQALSISQHLEYTCLPRICCLRAEEMTREKSAPLTRDRSKKKKWPQRQRTKTCRPRPPSLTDTRVSAIILLLMMHHFPSSLPLPYCYPRLLHRGRTRHKSDPPYLCRSSCRNSKRPTRARARVLPTYGEGESQLRMAGTIVSTLAAYARITPAERHKRELPPPQKKKKLQVWRRG
ncbi:unnamed protein product, partial [Ectocarpus sp. 12 AP-2014]